MLPWQRQQEPVQKCHSVTSMDNEPKREEVSSSSQVSRVMRLSDQRLHESLNTAGKGLVEGSEEAGLAVNIKGRDLCGPWAWFHGSMVIPQCKTS